MTRCATGQTLAFPVDKNDGIAGAVDVDDDGTLQLGVPLQYVDTGLTVIDLNTGLEWEKKDSLDTNQDFSNLHDADNTYTWSGDGLQETIWDWLDDVNAEGYAGHNDWRIANVRELQSIQVYGRIDGAIDPIFGPTAKSQAAPLAKCAYSSSTTLAPVPSRSWVVEFAFGGTSDFAKSDLRHVRAVRGGEL